MCFLIHLRQLLPADMGVNLRGRYTAVPQHFLDVPKVGAVIQHGGDMAEPLQQKNTTNMENTIALRRRRCDLGSAAGLDAAELLAQQNSDPARYFFATHSRCSGWLRATHSRWLYG